MDFLLDLFELRASDPVGKELGGLVARDAAASSS